MIEILKSILKRSSHIIKLKEIKHKTEVTYFQLLPRKVSTFPFIKAITVKKKKEEEEEEERNNAKQIDGKKPKQLEKNNGISF